MGCSSSKATDSVPAAAASQGAQTPAKTAEKKQDAAPVEVTNRQKLPPNLSIIFVLGGPGSGKGTQCEKLVQKFGYKHLSAGDLLREEVKKGSELGKSLETMMKEGKLVPSEVTIELLQKALQHCSQKGILIDGFPRALDQAHKFKEEIGEPRAVLFFDCPEDVMKERLLSRGKTSGRSDDEIETIKKRFVTYQESTLPVIEFYKKEGKLHHISAVPEPDEVFLATVRSLSDAQLVDAAAAGIELKPPPAEAAAAPPKPSSIDSAVEVPPKVPVDRIEQSVSQAPTGETVPQAPVVEIVPTPTGETVAYEKGEDAKVEQEPKASTLKSHAVRLTSDTAASPELEVNVERKKTAEEDDATPFSTPMGDSGEERKEDAPVDVPAQEAPVPVPAVVPATA